MIDNLHNETREDLTKCGVYTITNLVNNKIYVGSTANNFRARWRNHLNSLKKGVHHSSKLQNAFNKYGEKVFKFEILEITSKYDSTSIEKYWINMLNSVKLGYNVSNSTTGGCLGCKMSVKHKLILSIVNKNNNYFGGHSHSDESKKQTSKTLKTFYETDSQKVRVLKEKRRTLMIHLNKNVLNNVNKKPIIQIDINTNEEIKEWASASDVEKEMRFLATFITKVCKGKAKQAYGYKWKYKNLEF
jgi:group I intron endonuclease